ncbi:MAG: SusD/RagB family nutrient-binding outer membrane lipoprotein [Bacteroidia bacterium]|nr:SusD/RagB family nutrient-binding outer membrane lipoprotein [Bacteroidia bacterium]
MKKINQYKLFVGVCALSLLISCDYEDINTNPFEMTEKEGVRDGVAVGGLITAMEKTVSPVGTQADGTDVVNQYQIAYHLSADSWSGFFGQNNSWNGGNNNTSFFLMDGWISSTYTHSYTNVLDSWKKLKASSEKNNTPEVFALAQILKISVWHKTLETFGPMPYSHAADASMNIPFDQEKEVYASMFGDLTNAIEILTKKAENGVAVMTDYDAVYGGDTKKWVKYANSLMLRLAVRVRFADEEMAKKYATQAVKHSIGVMTAKDEVAQMGMGAGMVFRNNIEWLSEQYNETRMGSSMFSYLMGYEDPRLGAYFKPVDATSKLGQLAYDGKQYQAVPAGHTYGQNEAYKLFSKPNIASSTPTYWMRASEVYFLRAEAALVWPDVFGSAEALYKQGIEMSFQENGVVAPVDAYLNSTKVPVKHEVAGSYSCSFAAPTTATAKFEGSSEEKLEKIMIQKWIALYPNGQEAWTEWRRTGYPKLNSVMVNRGSSQGATKESGIRRMIYPTSFYQTEEGKAIYAAALKLFNNGQGGEDKSSTHLWWDCK